MRAPFVGQVLHMRTESIMGHFRVIFIAPEFDVVALYPLTLKKRRPTDSEATFVVTAKSPRIFKLSVVSQLDSASCEEVKFVLPSFTNRAFDELSKKQQAQYQKISERMQVIADPGFMLRAVLHDSFNAIVTDLAKHLEVDRTTLARDASRYFLCEMDIRKACMLSILGKGKQDRTRTVTKKLGRKNKLVSSGHLPDAVGINVDIEIRKAIEIFWTAKKRKPGDEHKKSMSQYHREFLDKWAHRAVNVLENGATSFVVDPEKDITRGQFAYYVHKLQSQKQREIATIGRAKFNKDKRVLTKTARELIQFPGQCYIIDSTVLDVYLVSGFDRANLVGRPVVYALIDAFSSMILSIHVALESSSLEEAKICLFRALTPKDQLFETLGMPDVLAALPAGCVPTSIFADRGEFLSEGGRSLAQDLNCRMSLAAPYRADWKSLVERYFGVQNQLVVHWVPGAVRARAKERGDRDVRHDAKLTVNDMLRMLLSLAAEWNLTHDMTGHVSAAMMRSGVDATPIGFWQYGLKHLHGSPQFLAREDAIRTFLPLLTVRASRSGLHAPNGLRYTAPWMTSDDDFFAQTREGQANIYLDPDRPLAAYLLDRKDGVLRPVSLVDNRLYGELDISVYDIRDTEELMELVRAEGKKRVAPIGTTMRRFRKDVERAGAAATDAAKEGDTRSKSRRVADLKENRRDTNAKTLGVSTHPPGMVSLQLPADDATTQAWASALDETFSENAQ